MAKVLLEGSAFINIHNIQRFKVMLRGAQDATQRLEAGGWRLVGK